ncbi:MAG: NADP-dependent oxidoreductase [Myxococcaceae bacterium]|nr:MAG: NADP-dependent oxidoreductase [Myxococcaceae bacterium]
MKAVLTERYGANDLVQLREIDPPRIGPKDVLVRVRAASINPLDSKIRDGKVKTLLHYSFPLVLGNDLSGEIVDIGSEVTRFAKGEAVYARLDKERIGSFAELAAVSEGAAAHKPSNLSHVEAASLPLVGLTCWQALLELGGLTRGQKVLIHGGSGGVGTFALQLARHVGATVYTTASARNHELVTRLGADVAIDYRQQSFEDVAKDCDVVFDTQGGETLLRSFSCVRPGGLVVSVGGVPDAKFARSWGLNPLLVLALRLMTRKVTAAAKKREAHFEYLFMRADGEQLAQITALVEQGVIKPVVDRTYPLAQAKDALAYSESGRVTGKVVLDVQ